MAAFGFQRVHGGRIGPVLVHIHYARHRVARCFNGTLRRKRLAAAVSRLAVSRKSIVMGCFCGSMARGRASTPSGAIRGTGVLSLELPAHGRAALDPSAAIARRRGRSRTADGRGGQPEKRGHVLFIG